MENYHAFYKNLGYELMNEITQAFGFTDQQIERGGYYENREKVYLTIKIEENYSIKFLEWRDTPEVPRRFYIIFFNENEPRPYVFQLDLSLLVTNDVSSFLWYLNRPTKAENIEVFKWLHLSPVDRETANYKNYCELRQQLNFVHQDEKLISKVLVENKKWDCLCDSFIELTKAMLEKHGMVNKNELVINHSQVGKERRDQADFRLRLLRLYDCQCVITGETTPEVIEAVRISKAGGFELENGILLRSDLRRLFDANLIAINPDTKKIAVSPQLRSRTEYKDLKGKHIIERQDNDNELDSDYLQERWDAAGVTGAENWLTSS
ncbi:HNH endonuclease [Rhodopseudomonas palustris]|uniref:HNH endonuclease n=2 Tax=Thiospirillum jenense TaxID=1653858 RepID=A0A839HBC1_9GAMM|nr:HNH endonuclease [Rhodopseudomonas palustris]MBB1124766.1 HNH endonuclease [Thiospirillum jenense]